MDDRQIEREIAGLLRGLESGPEDVSPDLQRNLERKLADGLRPVKPLRPAGFFVAIWSVIFAIVVAAGVLRLEPLALPEMGPAMSALVIGVLAASAVALMISLALQMRPGSRFRIAPGVLPVVVAAAVTVLYLVILPMYPLDDFWPDVRVCFSVGIATGAVAGTLMWLALRRGAFVGPAMAGVTAGLLAGLAGTTLLAIHCPILEFRHVALAHIGPAVAAALAGMAIAAASSPLRRKP
jgi:hypothetical protein